MNMAPPASKSPTICAPYFCHESEGSWLLSRHQLAQQVKNPKQYTEIDDEFCQFQNTFIYSHKAFLVLRDCEDSQPPNRISTIS